MDSAKRSRDGSTMTMDDACFSLRGFEMERCLSESDVSKMVILLGSFKDKQGQAIVILARRHLPTSTSECSELLEGLATEETLANDIYRKYAGSPADRFAAINVDVIHPCTDKHISKYSQQKTCMVYETPEMYAAVTEPHIAAIPAAATAWVINILEKKKEADRMIFEDPDPAKGFMLHPDLKWDRTQVDKLYCIALVHPRGIRSIRDLRPEHLPLLRNVLARGSDAIREQYGVPHEHLRVFVHYLPSYFHLHVHFMHMGKEATFGMATGKAHALQDVISSIEVCPDFYARATLACSLGENDPLYAKHQEHAAPAA
eukprot:jgi/Ulvmu1/3062/UM015_0102.1